MTIDLHVHSVFSDGSQSPTELVALAAARGLTAISITDHDTMAGTDEALQAGRAHGVEVLPGLEISAHLGQTYLHILGYGMRPDDPGLVAGLSQLQGARDERNRKIVQKLVEMGHAVSLEEVRRCSRVGQTGRPHIAKTLMARGVVKNMPEAFEKFLKKGAPAYVSRFVYDAENAIALIKRAGGLAVLAHPIQIDPSLGGLPGVLAELASLGLDGVELYYPTQSARTRKKIRSLADKYQLLYTGGSDYHGDIRPGTHLAGGKNVSVPADLLVDIRKRLKKI
ncbi:MAG: PHP domain-containing protein [Desulfocapsaceae bacterium]|nr:PHP domain-containing protein [Desulfocapsaceae bacterium]